MRALLLMALISAAFLSACAFQEAREYRIVRANSRDATKLIQILRSVAVQVGLPQTGAPGEKMPGFYRGDKVMLSAARQGGDIEIALLRWDWPSPRVYSQAEALLTPALSRTFGERLTVLPPRVVNRSIVTE